MKYTISTHNGSAVRRQHNLRNPKVVDRQKHIVKDGVHETWLDKDPRQAYRALFGAAQDAYNQRQLAAGRPERCIKSYYSEIIKDAKKHPVYEMIVTVGSKDSHPDQDLTKEILREFVDKWPSRNGSLELIGAYYHADEEGVAHVHVDYVPVATGYKNGLEVQNGLGKALNAIGFESVSAKNTAQIQWEHRENRYLEQLCRERGLEIEHPLEKGRKHLHTERYKAEAALKEAVAKKEAAEAREADVAEKVVKMRQEGQRRFEEYKSTLERQKEQISAQEAQINALDEEIKHRKAICAIFGGDPNVVVDNNNNQDKPLDFDELMRH